MSRSRHARVALFVAVAAALQLLCQASGKGYLLTQLIMASYYTVVAMGLSLLMGYAGQVSLGHAGFFAAGGYTAAVLTTADLAAHGKGPVGAALRRLGVLAARPDLYGGQILAVHPWAACLAAVLFTVAIAFVVGIPVLRLRGHYLAMATLGVGTILYSMVLATPAFGAADGISGVPPFPLLPGVSVSGDAEHRIANYYVACAVLALGLLVLENLVHSRVGRALRAIHGSEEAAAAMGVDTSRYKLATFVLSAALAAAAGVFLTHFNGSIGPSEASIMKSVRYVSIVAVGGMGSLWGTLAASTALNFLSLRGYFGTLDDAVFGAILILVMLFSPEGILNIDARAVVRALSRRSKAEEQG